ncbi:MAG: hypothetical protein ABR540_05625, partial [Acidimicrobiales bacterium]
MTGGGRTMSSGPAAPLDRAPAGAPALSGRDVYLKVGLPDSDTSQLQQQNHGVHEHKRLCDNVDVTRTGGAARPGASPACPGALLSLQRLAGNKAVSRLIVDYPSLQRSPAGQAVIDRFMNWGGMNLREEALGAELAGMLPANPTLVNDVLWTLPNHDRDDVSVALAEAVPNQADLAVKARGCEWLFRQMVIFLQ